MFTVMTVMMFNRWIFMARINVEKFVHMIESGYVCHWLPLVRHYNGSFKDGCSNTHNADIHAYHRDMLPVPEESKKSFNTP